MEAGQDPSRFWQLTLREIGVILDGVSNRLKREHNDRAWLAWHTARLTAYAPTKPRDFQKLKTLLYDAPTKQPKRRQTIEEQIAIAHRWTAAVTRH